MSFTTYFNFNINYIFFLFYLFIAKSGDWTSEYKENLFGILIKYEHIPKSRMINT